MPDHAAHPGHQFGTSAIFRFRSVCRWCLCASLLSACRELPEPHALLVQHALSPRLPHGQYCYADGIRWHAVHLAAADLAGWKIPAPPASFYARSEPESVSPVGRAVHITAFVARFVSLPVQHAAWRLLHAFASTGQWFLVAPG
ncbi:Uncharacterised protein [Shigella sonnei]|nr:Uncharacterised protein [Shigella sonnei]CSG18629.1 Uncharacterised protein [Shigella sonnei]CSG32642.1 Uncharacterised protein [Shigella sonnei]